MKTWCKKISPVFFIFSAFLFFAVSARAQITNVLVDPGPYTPGSSIAATFNIGSTCIKTDNIFNLYLVSSAGVETSIGQYTGFYTTFVNGIIPAGTAAGTYTLRIKTTSPAATSTDSAPITIQSGTAVLAGVSSDQQVMANNARDGKPEVFGVCSGNSSDRVFNLSSTSTSNSIITGTVKNEINGTGSTLTFNSSQIASFTANSAHYTVLIKASANGTVGTRAYFLLNNNTTIAFLTSGNDVVCLPTKLTYGVNPSDIAKNFPGDIYTINWGDGSSDSYTICDIINNSNTVEHLYVKSSCGSNFGNVRNAFGITISASNSFCTNIGTAISTTAKVVLRPVNSFSFGNPGCKATDIVFTNTSVAGENPNTTACTPNDVKYTWSVDGDVKATGKDINFNFVYNFTQKGPHTITLTSTNPGACNADPYTATICIQDPPQPAFNLSSATVCTQTVVTPVDASVIDPTCDASNTYTWSVSPNSGVTINNPNSKTPGIIFSAAGNYTITLSVSTPSCGAFTASKPITVNTTPTAILSPDIKLCNLTTYDFNPTTTGPTKSTLTGTTSPTAGTYTWTVTGGIYSFENGTSASSQYPSIKFNEYVEYTVSVVHTNGCGTAPAVSQKLIFISAPVVNAGADQTICFNTPGFSLNGVVTGSTTSQTWIGGGGTFTPDRNSLTATYTPTAAEKTAGSVNLVLRAITGLTGTCDHVDDEVVLKINPNITVTSLASKTICTGLLVGYMPTSNPTGATYTWTATGTANATGFNPGSGTTINDVLNNTDLVNDATVTYTITPRLNNCDGAPFTFIVTIKAKSVGGTTAASNNDVCAGANGGSIALSGNIGNIIRWESSTDGGQTWQAIASSTSNPYVFSNLPQTTQFRAVVQNSVCDVATSSVTTITVNPAIPDANAGGNQFLCGDNTATLNGNKTDAPYNGKWSLVSAQTGVTFADPTLFNTMVSGLLPGETYTFRWTISGAATCDPKSSEVTITVYKLLTNTVSTTATEVCAGQNVVITGDIPTGGNGTYTFQWQSSTDGNTWTAMNGQTAKDLNIQVTASSFYRRIVNSNVCTANSNAVEVKTLPGLANNSIATDQTICSGTAAQTLKGSTPTGGSGTYAYQWQSSIDNGATWTDIGGANSPDFTPPTPTITTLYRRSVAGGPCSDFSNPVKITVNPPAKSEFTFTTDVGCNPFVLTAANIKATPYPDRNNTYTWFADGVLIPNGTGINFPGFTITGDNKSVEIKLVVTSSLGCSSSEMAHTFSTQANVTASYTQNTTQGCGPLSVTFTNTSNTPSAATFKWDFGNGTTSNLAQPPAVVYQPDPTGKDITYTIVMQAVTPCGTTSQTSTVLVKAKPISVFSPDKTSGCSPFTVTFSNTSPGNSGTYTYDFGDGTTLTATDKNSVTHTYTTLTVKNYIVKMVAANDCGTSETQYSIQVAPNTITPEMVVNSNQLKGCAPFKVDFYNNTKGANTFVYDFGDGTTALTNTAPEVVSHIFTKGGKYTVTLYATNGCSNASTVETIEVLEQPTVAFSADRTSGCDGLTVNFKNNSSNAVGYLWDFGDGTTSNDFEPQHIFKGAPINYTVSLKATNTQGCSNISVVQNYISLVSPPQSVFTVLPGNELSIPNFTFNFRDASLNGAASWAWNFGDGTTSTLQNPTHTYADIGSYQVTLNILNKEGCASTSVQAVRIIDNPGFLFVPNSFMPGSQKSELQTFKAKGRGINNWTMTVFNKWGQVLWETTKLNDGAPLEGWDGRYKGQDQPQGVYFWKIEVKFINGSEWKGMTYDSSAPKKTGNIYLIR